MAGSNDPTPQYYHGTKADLKPGDLIRPGYNPNFGRLDRKTSFVYLTATLDAATWGAELDRKFPGNPTKSYRTREPLRVVGEVTEWQGHSEEQLRAMREGL